MLISYPRALEMIQENIIPLLNTERTVLLESVHRIASDDVYAYWDMPHDAISLKDGYGLYLKKNPLETSQNTIIELSTGDTLEPHINTVIAKEDVTFNSDGTFNIPNSSFIGQNIKQKGEDFSKNQCILKRYESINAYTLAVLASQGLTHVETFSSPKVSILSIGNSLLSLGKPMQSGKIYNSNAISLAARIGELGAQIGEIKVCSEDATCIIDKLTMLSQKADFVITTGGMGIHDAMHQTLAHPDLSIVFQSVQISPARPSALSFLNHTPILHLPGLPLACLLGFEMLGSPILKRLQHIPLHQEAPITLCNQQMITCKACSTSAIPGFSDGKNFTNAISYHAGMLATLSHCNGYILTEGQEQLCIGESVLFYPF